MAGCGGVPEREPPGWVPGDAERSHRKVVFGDGTADADVWTSRASGVTVMVVEVREDDGRLVPARDAVHAAAGAVAGVFGGTVAGTHDVVWDGVAVDFRVESDGRQAFGRAWMHGADTWVVFAEADEPTVELADVLGAATPGAPGVRRDPGRW